MALNVTGRLPSGPREPPPSRAPVFLLACLGLAAALGGLVFALAVRQPRPPAPPRPSAPLATLIGVSDPSPPAVFAAQTAAPPPATPQPAASQPAAPASAAPAPTAATPTAPAPSSTAKAPPAPPAKPPEPSVAEIRARMLDALRRGPHGVITLSVEDDAGAQAYARQLGDLFRAAGWTVSMNAVFGAGPPMRGLSAALGATPADEAVRGAFAAVNFVPGPPPPAAIVETPELFVGAP